MKYIIKIITVLFFTGYCSFTLAYTNTCTPVGGEQNFSANVGTITITDPTKNTAGSEFDNAGGWSTGAAMSLYCDCNAFQNHDRYFTAISTLPTANVNGSTGQGTWYQANNNLAVAVKLWIGGNVNDYIAAPFDSYDNKQNAGTSTYGGCGTSGGTSNQQGNIGTGNKGQVSLYIIAPFVGTSSFNEKIFDMYMTTSASASPTAGAPYAAVNLSGSVTIPLTCQVNSGTQLTVDLGGINSTALMTKDAIATGFTPRQVSVPIHCNNIDATAQINLKFVATKPDGKFMGTDNPDVDVAVMDNDQNILDLSTNPSIPQNITAGSGYAGDTNIDFYVAPVSATGNEPDAGNVQATGELYVEYD